MLLQLRIHDFAIIDHVELELPAGFTVITGETGAGKSILVNALTLVLGGRASADVVRAGAKNARVEALFDIAQHPVVRARLEQRELIGDDPDTLLVRRMVGGRGRGKVVINGHMSTVATLAEIVRGLVDISGQHEQQSLLEVDGHLDILDNYGQLEEARAGLRTAFQTLRGLEAERRRLQQNADENLRRGDYLRFLLEEIERVGPVANEEESLQVERQRLGHAEKLSSGAQLAEALLYGDDGSAFDKLGKAAAEVETLARIDPSLQPTVDALNTARQEIEEAARDLLRYADGIEAEPARLEEVETRLADLSRLTRKHGGSTADVLARAQSITQELDGLEHSEERTAGLQNEIETAQATVIELAAQLSEERHAAATTLQESVAGQLGDMDLDGAVFQVRIGPRRGSAETLQVGDEGEAGAVAIGPSGADEVEYLWSANPGEPPRPLARIASGGELSRLMLAVKTVLCNRDLVSLYVFDEVDTGLGGRAADRIGRKIQNVAKGHQAITITHLAPIAARADHHLRVSKSTHDVDNNERTTSRFDVVDGTARAEEIARMIDGAQITKATRQAAKEMLSRR